jgi:hypothetical protein
LVCYLVMDVLLLNAYASREFVYGFVAQQWLYTSQYNDLPLVSVSLYHNLHPLLQQSSAHHLGSHFGPKYRLVRDRVTLRIAVYRQSVRLGDKPIEAHEQRLFFATEPLQHYVTSSLTSG